MKIAIDGKPLTFNFFCGVQTYSRNYINALAKIDKYNHYTIYVPYNIEIPKQSNFKKSIIKGILPWQIRFAQSILRDGTDIVHFLQQHGSVFISHPHIVTTVHDISPLNTYPSLVDNPSYALLGIYVWIIRKMILSKSDILISVSNFTKHELIKQKIHKRIIVIPEGIGKEFRRKKNNLHHYYILAMTDFSPRKNIMRIIEAFSRLSISIRSKYKLIIVLSMKHLYKKIISEIDKRNIRDSVEIFHSLNTAKLSRLYQQASVFLYPSFYEGFGLPILEAMASGCPVITSNYGAMKEVAGDSAYLVNPYSVSEIAHAMETLLCDSQMRNTLIEKGLKHAKKFSWEQTARETLCVYEQVYQS